MKTTKYIEDILNTLDNKNDCIIIGLQFPRHNDTNPFFIGVGEIQNLDSDVDFFNYYESIMQGLKEIKKEECSVNKTLDIITINGHSFVKQFIIPSSKYHDKHYQKISEYDNINQCYNEFYLIPIDKYENK